MRPHTPARDRFWTKVDRSAGPEACWPWLAYLTPNGYGLFSGDNRWCTSAHRFAYEFTVGPIPPGLVLDHLCSNRRCVNPAHLEPVTQAENMRRARKTTCLRGHPLTGDNLWAYISGGTFRRECRTCIHDRGKGRGPRSEPRSA